MRIDPNAGQVVVVGGVTNHVGAVDMVVDLGAQYSHPPPYGAAAHPYNYSDMTGFNQRVVNPGLVPLKGYWTVINDCGVAGELWRGVVWNAFLTNGCSMEVYVRADDDRQALANAPFVAATNNHALVGVKGRYIEVRLALGRDDASKQPLLYDLTLYGSSTSFAGDLFLDDQTPDEGSDAHFPLFLAGPEPLGYQWFIQYPWTNQMALVSGATNSEFVITNVDSWIDGAWVSVYVTNATGEGLWLGPAELWVVPVPIHLPGSGSSGPASRYPATINVFGQPTDLASVTVTLDGLSHSYPEDLNVLLVSPAGTNIMLMSDAGGNIGVTNSILVFRWFGSLPPAYPNAFPSYQTLYYKPSNYGQKTQLPGAPAGPYSTSFDDLVGENPNGNWTLYIYDDKPGGVGQLQYSWRLDFTFQ
jgi:hypothetical protein